MSFLFRSLCLYGSIMETKCYKSKDVNLLYMQISNRKKRPTIISYKHSCFPKIISSTTPPQNKKGKKKTPKTPPNRKESKMTNTKLKAKGQSFERSSIITSL